MDAFFSTGGSLLVTQSNDKVIVHALPTPLTNGNIFCTNTIQDNRLTIQCKKYYYQEIAEKFSLAQLYHLIKLDKLGEDGKKTKLYSYIIKRTILDDFNKKNKIQGSRQSSIPTFTNEDWQEFINRDSPELFTAQEEPQ